MNAALQINKDDELQVPKNSFRPRRKSNKVNKQNINSTNFNNSSDSSKLYNEFL